MLGESRLAPVADPLTGTIELRNAMERARGAAAGVFAGGLTAAALNWNEPDGVHRAFVDECLKERGHKVLGWR